jgi:hypothetical protein
VTDDYGTKLRVLLERFSVLSNAERADVLRAVESIWCRDCGEVLAGDNECPCQRGEDSSIGLLAVHDCGAPYFTGQAHICDDVRLAHEGCDEES